MYRSNADGSHTNNADLELLQHGYLNLRQMFELLQPGAVDPQAVVGRRVRWAYTSSRSQNTEAKRVSDELKLYHLRMGAAEVVVHRGPWLEEESI